MFLLVLLPPGLTHELKSCRLAIAGAKDGWLRWPNRAGRTKNPQGKRCLVRSEGEV